MEPLRAVAAAAYYGDEAVMRRLGYDAAERVRRGAEVRGEEADGGIVDGATITGDRVVRADVCVIGSGAGGAVVAKELAEAGARVVLLEEGAQHSAAEFTARPRDMLPKLYRDAAQHATIGRPPILLPLGKAVGGTTLVNSGTCFRTPDHVLARWRDEFGLEDLTPEALAPLFARVEETLNVVPVPPELAGANAHVAKRGADALGWSGDFVRRNVRGCVGSGVCAYGCPANAKQHVGVSYIPKAHAAGATTYTGVTARRLGRGVEASTTGGGRLRVDAPKIVVAAGAIHTPALLARNGLGGPQLGRNLSLHPATAVWALMDEPVDMARGVPQSYFVDEFASEGIMLEGIAGPPDYVAMGLPVAGERHRELMAGYQEMAQFGLMISDDSRGRVHSLAGRPLVRYDLSDTDTARVRTGLEKPGRAVLGRRRAARPAAPGPQAGAAPGRGDPRPPPPRPQADGLPPARHRAHGRAGPAPRRPRRPRPRARDGGRLRLRRQRGPLLARRQPPDHDHDPRDQIGPPLMSFLIDGPWLYANGRAIARTGHPTELAAGTMAVFWGVSIPLYLNRRWTRPIWRACRASSGRDWMINSGVLKVDADKVSTRGHAISAAIFATYPLWLWLGLRHGKR